MSRIGKSPIVVPDGVDLTLDGATVKVKGPKGELEQIIDPKIGVELQDNVLTFTRSSDHKDDRSKHGLYRSLVSNMIEGVTNGYSIKLELVGVGFRASSSGQDLTLALGFSHSIVMRMPQEIKLEAETKKGEKPYVKLTSHDKQLIGAVAAKIRSLRKPEPYKGKGVRYAGEQIRRKAGKTAAK
ncbi:MAG TPA: 50S ribosomal protein L6 [Flavobacteriales bacterium]|jgi:large subunit ribosomal protein L6|nr:50S ribosomal protein L6 [Flavobacteriales bacterium]